MDPILAILAPRPLFREVILIGDLDYQVVHMPGVGIHQVGDTREGKIEFLRVAADGQCFHARLIACRAVVGQRQPISIRRIEGYHLVVFGALGYLFQRAPIRHQPNRVRQDSTLWAGGFPGAHEHLQAVDSVPGLRLRPRAGGKRPHRNGPQYKQAKCFSHFLPLSKDILSNL
jgi:hypothetical protein